MSGITFRYSTPDGIEAPVLLWRKGKRHGLSNRGKEKTCSPCPFKTGPTANQLFGFHTMVACQVKKLSFVFHTKKLYKLYFQLTANMEAPLHGRSALFSPWLPFSSWSGPALYWSIRRNWIEGPEFPSKQAWGWCFWEPNRIKRAQTSWNGFLNNTGLIQRDNTTKLVACIYFKYGVPWKALVAIALGTPGHQVRKQN